MDILTTILGIILTILGWLLSIVLWFLSFLLMPLLILAILAAVALRFAWRNPLARPYLERWFKRLGDKGFTKLKKFLYLITLEPFRVIFRFFGFALLYAWVNLWWRPKWDPWMRARQRPAKKANGKPDKA